MQMQNKTGKLAFGVLAMAAALAADAASITSTASSTLPTPFWIDDGSNNGSAVAKEHRYTLSNTQFDTQLGVLTAASATLSNRGLLGAESGSASNGGEAWMYMEARMPGSYAALSGLPSVTVSGAQQRFSLVSTSQTLPFGGSLSPFAGTGTVESQVYLVLVAEKTAGGSGLFSGSVVGRLDGRPFVTTQTIEYAYLQHANASFASGVDSDSLSLSVGPGSTTFEVFALAGSLGAAETTKLDAASLTCVFGCSDFEVSHLSVQDVQAGASALASASLRAHAPGTYTAQYLLSFSDDTAVGVGQQLNTLTLNLSGSVTAVPEPGAWAMWLAGLAGVHRVVRRRGGRAGWPSRSPEGPA